MVPPTLPPPPHPRGRDVVVQRLMAPDLNFSLLMDAPDDPSLLNGGGGVNGGGGGGDGGG